MLRSNWDTLPAPVLQYALEGCSARDGCAAACACKTWRATINDRHIPQLHLSANSSSEAKLWGPFLASRSTIGQLKLTGPANHSSHSLPVLCSAEDSPMAQIPLACDTLSVNQFFVRVIHHYTDRPAHLTRLNIDFGSSTQPQLAVSAPNVRHMSCLQSLHLTIDNPGLDALMVGLKCCPKALQSFSIEGKLKGSNRLLQQPLRLSYGVQQELCTRLASLRNLELVGCKIAVSEGTFTALMKLTGLSLRSSGLHLEGACELEALTNLVLLDLAHSVWHLKGMGFQLHHFTGWSALQVLKINMCCLIGYWTTFALPFLAEMHVNSLVPGMKSSNSHFLGLPTQGTNELWELLTTMFHPDWASSFVTAHLDLSTLACSASHLSYCVSLVLTHCVSLQHLDVQHVGNDMNGVATFVLDQDCGKHLTTLSLAGFMCSLIDLRSSRSLSSIHLSNIDWLARPCDLLLPASVQCLSFRGFGLFDAENTRVPFLGVSQLTKLVFGPGYIANSALLSSPTVKSADGLVCLAELPHTLRHLELDCPQRTLCGGDPWPDIAQSFLEVCDWQCLRCCTYLERLTLPRGVPLPGPLATWIKAAQHLQLVFDSAI